MAGPNKFNARKNDQHHPGGWNRSQPPFDERAKPRRASFAVIFLIHVLITVRDIRIVFLSLTFDMSVVLAILPNTCRDSRRKRERSWLFRDGGVGTVRLGHYISPHIGCGARYLMMTLRYYVNPAAAGSCGEGNGLNQGGRNR